MPCIGALDLEVQLVLECVCLVVNKLSTVTECGKNDHSLSHKIAASGLTGQAGASAGASVLAAGQAASLNLPDEHCSARLDSSVIFRRGTIARRCVVQFMQH